MAKARILIVEDETIVSLDLQSRLESLGYEVVGTIDSGEEAVEKAREFAPDAVLMDINLKGAIDGIEAALRIRRSQAIPVIYVTACVDEKTLQRAKVTEPFGYIIKPFEDRELHSHIEIALYKNQIEIQLRQREERYSLATRGADDGLWDWNLETGQIYFSPRWESLLGYSPGELGSSSEQWLSKVHSSDRDRLKRELSDFMKGRGKRFRSEYRIQHKEGSYRWMLTRGFALRDPSGEVYRMAGSQTDVTDRKIRDPLTGLPNRALFMDRLECALSRTLQDSSNSFAVFVLKSESFKRVNDTLGYQVGDVLLGEFIQRLQDCLDEQSTVVSLGEEGFAVLLGSLDGEAEATRISSQIQYEMKPPFRVGEEEVSVRLVVGIAIGENRYEQPEDALRDAQTAANRAQEQGLNSLVFDSNMRVLAVSRLRLEGELRQALEKEEFLLYYQPIVSLRDGHLIGFEALVRWQPEENRIVSPGEFIPMAEETGLIIPLERWVLAEASRQLKIWQEVGGNPELALSVNFSPEQYRQTDLVETLQKNLLETGLDPRTLRLEITESTFLKDSATLNELLTSIRKINIQLHMDDFGTGYSSLSYLHRFPINVLKIDRSFVSNMSDSAQAQQIVEAIAHLGKNLRLGVTAEGIETLEQLRALQELGCDYGQGFYFSKPVNTTEAEVLVKGELPWRAVFEQEPEATLIDSSDQSVDLPRHSN